jgi:hypothetical protein
MSVILPRDRLAAVLARLESPFDGERAAAGLIASKMVREAGMTWSDLLAASRTADRPVCDRRTRSPWREMLANCRKRPDLLTKWERRFVASIDGQARLSRKQWAILASLADRVNGGDA